MTRKSEELKKVENSMNISGGQKRCKWCGRVFSLMKSDLAKIGDGPYECSYCKSLPRSKRGKIEKVGEVKEEKDFDDDFIQGEK